MNRIALFFGLILLIQMVGPLDAAENESVVTTRITSIGMFKNGMIVVREELSLPGPGRFVLENPPVPIHGTFFVESDDNVSIVSTLRDVQVPLGQTGGIHFNRDLVGQKVRVGFANKEVFEGEVVSLAENDHEVTPPDLDPYRSTSLYRIAEPKREQTASQLLLKRKDGSIVVLRADSIAFLELIDGTRLNSLTRKKPVMIFNVAPQKTKTDAKDNRSAQVAISYLTSGMTWAPAWRVDALNAGKVKLSQTVSIINQWRSFENVPVFLISGYPQIMLKGVTSPLDPAVTLESFFRSLARADSDSGIHPSSMAQQAMMNAPMPAPNTPESLTITSGEGPDLFFQPIGLQSLRQGDRLFLTPATLEASCERIVCWNIPDNRNEWGKVDNDHSRGRAYGHTTSGEMERSGFSRFREPWDVWEFANPFKFPMTTAPTAITDNNRFAGQTMSFWTGPGERNSLAVNKALSIRVESREEEIAPAVGKPARAPTPSSGKSSVPVVSPTGGDLMTAIQDATGGAVLGNRIPAKLPPGIDPSRVNYDGSGHPRVTVHGDTYRIATVKATISLVNLRKEEIKAVVRRRFSGERIIDSDQLEADIAKTIILTDEKSGLNRRQESTWNLTLAPGEKKSVTFVYQVLIRI